MNVLLKQYILLYLQIILYFSKVLKNRKMNYFVRILLINLCMVLALQVDAQSTSNSKTKKADKAFALEQYNKAAELYKKAYSKTKNRAL